MSKISQELLDKLNKEKPGPGSDPSELEKFNAEYNLVLAEMEKRKKKKVVEDTSYIPGDLPDNGPIDPDDHSADHIPGPGSDGDDDDRGEGDASHIPD